MAKKRTKSVAAKPKRVIKTPETRTGVVDQMTISDCVFDSRTEVRFDEAEVLQLLASGVIENAKALKSIAELIKSQNITVGPALQINPSKD